MRIGRRRADAERPIAWLTPDEACHQADRRRRGRGAVGAWSDRLCVGRAVRGCSGRRGADTCMLQVLGPEMGYDRQLAGATNASRHLRAESGTRSRDRNRGPRERRRSVLVPRDVGCAVPPVPRDMPRGVARRERDGHCGDTSGGGVLAELASAEQPAGRGCSGTGGAITCMIQVSAMALPEHPPGSAAATAAKTRARPRCEVWSKARQRGAGRGGEVWSWSDRRRTGRGGAARDGAGATVAKRGSCARARRLWFTVKDSSRGGTLEDRHG